MTASISLVPLYLCLAGLAVTLMGEATGFQSLRASGKIVAALAFIAFGVALGIPAAEPHGRAVMIAFCLSAVGDVALLSKQKRWFLLGLVAFLLAHVAYVGAFCQLGPVLSAAGLTLVPVAVVAGLIWRWLSPAVGEMRGPVLAYIAVICSMVTVAGGVAGKGGEGPTLLLVAAVLFFASDLFVARQRFVSPSAWNRYVGLPLYFGAQLLFGWAASLV